MMDSFISDVWNTWRDEEYLDLCDEMRDADLTDSEMSLADRFNINFYDDVLDPLNIYHDIRKGNILHGILDKYEKILPFTEMYRITDSYLIDPSSPNWKNSSRHDDVMKVSADLRSIRIDNNG